jgi:hypothetical protein
LLPDKNMQRLLLLLPRLRTCPPRLEILAPEAMRHSGKTTAGKPDAPRLPATAPSARTLRCVPLFSSRGCSSAAALQPLAFARGKLSWMRRR